MIGSKVLLYRCVPIQYNKGMQKRRFSEAKGKGNAMKKDFVSEALRSLLGKRCAPLVRALLALAGTAVFYLFAMNARYAILDDFASFQYDEFLQIIGVMFTAVFAVSACVQMKVGKRLPLYALAVLLVITGCVTLGKISLLDYVSDDYDIFLSDWIYTYSSMGIKEGLGTYIGSDYTPPYLYLMLLISRVRNFPWLYMVKAISMLTDVLLGYAVMKLCSLKVKGEGAQLLTFHIAQILPTVVFNGAYWGQCDGIYVSFCLLALYLSLSKKPVRGMAAFGVALSFKLQTVFFLPALLPLWLRKDVKLRHVLMIPATYMVMMIPALWGGKSMHHVLTCYLQQAGNYNFITMNGPSLYQFLPLAAMDATTLYNMFSGMAMMLGFAMLLIVCALACLKREAMTRENALLCCLLVLGGVPFFLPKMHERYTFGADVLALVLAVYAPKRIVLPLLFGLASYICYTEGLPGEPIVELKWAAVCQMLGIALTAAALWRGLNAGDAPELTEVKA